MSTRSQIVFYEKPTDKLKDFAGIIYKHSDGYPYYPGNLFQLMPALNDFEIARGMNDIDYAMAHIIYILKKNMVEDSKAWFKKGVGGNYNFNDYKKKATKFKESSWYQSSFLSIGTSRNDDFHGDVEWVYRIDMPLKEVRVFHTLRNWCSKGSSYEKQVELKYIVPFNARGKFSERSIKRFEVK